MSYTDPNKVLLSIIQAMAAPKHWEGYADAVSQVRAQSLEEDLDTLDALYGRDNLRYGATPEEVKEEALKQVERDWRIPEKQW